MKTKIYGLLLAASGALGLVLTGSAATRYVAISNDVPAYPYTNWATAARVIQDAVDAADPGDEILVADGVYATGGRAVYGTMTNRVAIDKPVTVRSVSGPNLTWIIGQGVGTGGTKNGDGAIRCVYLGSNAILSGFTLTNGYTRTTGDYQKEQSGGGAWCETNGVLTNCVLTGNSSQIWGGGAYSGTLNNCTLTRNFANTYGGGSSAGTLNNCTLTGNLANTYGGGAYSGTLNNCTIMGNLANNGGGVHSGTLNDCSLSANLAFGYGGGTRHGTLNNCTLTGNSADYGGGSSGGTLNNCSLTGNTAYTSGGGVHSGTLNNCTLTGNSARYGGGSSGGTLNNCIVYYNSARQNNANYQDGILNYCCSTPLPAGTGNIADEPLLASASHLSDGSPCRGQGSAAYSSDEDIDGEPWANPPSIGCDEYWSGSVTGALSVAVVAAYTNVVVGFELNFQAVIGGRVSASCWDFGNGCVVSNRPWAAHSWAAAGDYVVELRAYNESHPNAVAATITVHVSQQQYYLAMTSTNPVSPYTNWATAAVNIQDAVDAALPGALVWVSNGVYQTGARLVNGMSNRVAVTKPVIVRSVNGAAVTQIIGYKVPVTMNGPAAVRCVYLTNGAVLSGFTLTNGATHTTASGGGVACDGANAVVSHCILTGNSATSGGGASSGTLDNCVLMGNCASNYGGGASGGSLNNCTLTENSAGHGGGSSGGTLNNCLLMDNTAGTGGGAYGSTLNKCTLTSNSAEYGGGAENGTLNNCVIAGNSAYSYGGGAFYAILNKCLVIGNSANDSGGGAYYGTLNNCSLTGNSANNGGGVDGTTLTNCTLTGNSANDYGGGAFYGTLNNCIVYFNSARNSGPNYLGGTLNYCCTMPPPPGTGNLTNAPVFVDTNGWSNLRLQSNSPCINAGNNAYAVGDKDLDGRSRTVGESVDMGAYEFQGAGMSEFIGWLQEYGLPSDGSADHIDVDVDGLNNWQEWRCRTDPTNALSGLRLLSPSPSSNGVNVSWQSVAGVSYYLECSTNLGASPRFNVLATNLPGQASTTVFTDTNLNLAPRFYRVGAP